MRTRIIYALMLVLLGLRVLELHAALPLIWHRVALIALIVGIYSLLFAWFRIERNSAQPKMERQPARIQPQTK